MKYELRSRKGRPVASYDTEGRARGHVAEMAAKGVSLSLYRIQTIEERI